MYEAVHAHSDGRSTVARLALTASEYGFDGLVVRNHGDEPASYSPDDIADTYDIDIVPGVEIRAADPSQASGFVGSHRDHQRIVAVHGGTPAINRFAVEQPQVDVLAHPMVGEGDFNHVLAKAAARNAVRIEFNLGGVLRKSGGTRVRRLRELRKLREIVTEYDAPYVVSADPHSHLQLRAPRELRAVGEAVGFDAEAIDDGLAEWARLAERNRDRQSESYVEPGVRRVDDGE
ncbi:RNase P subunit p30 family protein [Halovenus sp. HT40]|uniref:RNase P subunit p30 family protein n=1 Tax=Halovenus sp. HT40 TaxID=3126691 RepID=UPI00300E8BBE